MLEALEVDAPEPLELGVSDLVLADPLCPGLEVEELAAFVVRDRVEPVDLDLGAGRSGDFTILLSLVALLLADQTANRQSQTPT